MLTKDLNEKGLIELLGIEDMSLEQQTEIVESASKTVEARVLNRILSGLDNQETARFMKIVEVPSGDGSEMEAFLTEKKINLKALLEEEILGFKKDLLGITEEKNQTQTA